MLEVQVKLPTVCMKGCICLGDLCEEGDVQTLALPLHSGRMCKRLIYLTSSGYLSFDLQAAQVDFELQHFRLARVTQRFAYSRMLMKLQALHPRYKVRKRSHSINAAVVDLAKSADMQTLWADYCALFEDSAEIVPYLGWVREFDVLSEEAHAAMDAKAPGVYIKAVA